MTKEFDRNLLAYKINWEGGVLATLDYGLLPEQIADPELRKAWTELASAHAKLRPLVEDFERLLSGT